MASQHVEDYLKSIYRLQEGGGKVSTSSLSEWLGVSAPSVTEMIKKLAEEGILTYKSQKTQKYIEAERLISATIPTFIDADHAIAHNKVMIIDNETVITGSFNFTKAAEERNAENLLIIRDKRLASLYVNNWNLHHEHSVPFSSNKLLKTEGR